jgi:hypothetical protein
LLAIFGVFAFYTACEQVVIPKADTDFVAVTGISGELEQAIAGTPLVLTGAVEPKDATYKTIVWSVKSTANTAGASIIGTNKLNTTTPGSVTVTATIANGLAQGTAYTQNFTIEVLPAGSHIPVKGISGVPKIAAVGLPLDLAGTVEPANAANKTIVWSVTDAGTTGAAIAPGTNTLNAFSEGTVTVTATIANGETETTPYTQDFTIKTVAPFTNTGDIAGDIAAYLASNVVENVSPIPLFMALELSETNWNAILTAINSAGKLVALDLSACTASAASEGGGLRSSGTFDPQSSVNTGKARIVSLALPLPATGIVEGNSSIATFRHFTALEAVSGAGVTSIGKTVFSDCYALTGISFPLAASIGDYAFSGCSALASASFPAAVTIGKSAFYNCLALDTVSFPLAVTIGDYAFSGCTALTGVSFQAAASIGGSAFFGCSALDNVSFPQAVSIGGEAFSGCTALTSVSFQAAASIGGSAFRACTALASVTLGATPPELGTAIFGSSAAAQTVTVMIPASASTGYGVSAGFDFDNESTADSWGMAFKGKGWSGGTGYGSGTVNRNITLVFQSY